MTWQNALKGIFTIVSKFLPPTRSSVYKWKAREKTQPISKTVHAKSLIYKSLSNFIQQCQVNRTIIEQKLHQNIPNEIRNFQTSKTSTHASPHATKSGCQPIQLVQAFQPIIANFGRISLYALLWLAQHPIGQFSGQLRRHWYCWHTTAKSKLNQTRSKSRNLICPI